MRNNPISELPAGFSALRKLETLWLDSCPVMNFEKELLKIKDIRIKNLSILGDNLSVLPTVVSENIGNVSIDGYGEGY